MAVVRGAEKRTVELDDVLVKFNLFAPYYAQNFVFIFLGFMTNSIYSSHYVFVAEEVGYRCRDPALGNNTCFHPENASLVCSQWEYDNPHTFVAEFNLACQEWKRTLVGTVHSVGYMCGLLFVGLLSDRLGRTKMAALTGVLGGVLGAARSFTASYWVYIALAFAESAIGDICSPLFMLTLEMVPSKRRIIFYMLCGYGFTLGTISLPIIAWLVPYWRSLLRVMYTPALLFFFYLFILDESPRWLLSKGDKDKAVAIMEKVARKNKVKLDPNLLEKLSYEEAEGVPFLELLKSTFASRPLLKRFFICLVWWTTSTFVNYGMTINSVSLQGNKYVNFALTSVVDIPGNLIIMAILYRFKRKKPLIFSFTAAAILCSIQPFVPMDLPWLSVLLYMAGKLMSSFYFTITYIFTSELFPTYTRNSMHALCSSLGRIGSIIAPQTPLLMHLWPGLPSLVFGCASLLAGLITFFVPDASDDALPDTVKQAEALSEKPRKECDNGIPVYVINQCEKNCSRLGMM